MGTTKLPAIFRFMQWLEHRRTLCTYCHRTPKADGSKYCSDYCSHSDAEMQAHA